MPWSVTLIYHKNDVKMLETQEEPCTTCWRKISLQSLTVIYFEVISTVDKRILSHTINIECFHSRGQHLANLLEQKKAFA